MAIPTINSSFNVTSDTLTIWANYLNSMISTLNSVVNQINNDPSTYFSLADISTGLSLINSKLKVTDVRLSSDNDLASLRGGISAINISEVSTNFNSLVEHGIYYTTTSSNTPENLTGGFFVIVLKKDTNIAQFAMHNSSNSVYFRFSNNTGTSFSEWNKCSSVTGNANVKGLVKLSDATDSTSDVDDGVAATPKAVNSAIAELNIPATDTSLGMVKVGETLDITGAGVLNVKQETTFKYTETLLTLPIATNDAKTVPSYIVGSNSLQVFIDGIKCTRGITFEEVGTVGSTSTSIKFLDDISTDYTVEVVTVDL